MKMNTLNIAWIYLIIAGLFEIGWPLGFKLSQTTRFRASFILLAVASMLISGLFLWLAQRDIPIGTAYAVWTGIGAAGTFLLGIIFFGDALGMMRLLSFLLIVTGVIGMKLS
ncbi:MAG: multidrug efflux SMR transporter [Smithellaceae bacterium]|nr:multidrug efflux SMR transporter [Smithellaceae bacterium]